MEYPDKFFHFLDQLTNTGLWPSSTRTAEEESQLALDLAVSGGIIEDAEALARIHLNLVLSAASPKLEAFYNYYAANYGDDPCESWVEWNGNTACDVEMLTQLITRDSRDVPTNSSAPYVFFGYVWEWADVRDRSPTRAKLLPFDHIYPPPNQVLESPPHTAILYGRLSAPNLRGLHNYLLKLSNTSEPLVEYVFRPIGTERSTASNYDLTGYGVALDLKKMDYLALDDRNQGVYSIVIHFLVLIYVDGSVAKTTSELGGREARVDPVLPLILAHPESIIAPDANAPLSADEISELGAQAVQIIASSDAPLTALIHLSQNFPKYATSLARRVVVNSSIAEELHRNSFAVQRGLNAFWLNGLQVDARDVNPFALLRLLKKEKGIVNSLVEEGLTRSQAFELLTHNAIANQQRETGVLDTIFDASDRLEGENIIVWWNDIEKDTRYGCSFLYTVQ